MHFSWSSSILFCFVFFSLRTLFWMFFFLSLQYVIITIMVVVVVALHCTSIPIIQLKCVCFFFRVSEVSPVEQHRSKHLVPDVVFFPAVAVVAPFWPPLLLLLVLSSSSYFSLTCNALRKSGIVNCADKNVWWFDKVKSYESSCNSKSHTLKWAEYSNKCIEQHCHYCNHTHALTSR